MPRLSLIFPGGLPALALAGCLLGSGACVEQTDEKPTAEDMETIKKNLLTTPPAPKFALNADLDGKVVYLGLDTSANPIEPGKEFKLTHYWKVVSPPGPGWRLFTHLNGPNNQQFLNVDHGPVNGKYPVSQWKAGDIIRDEHAMRLPPTWSHDKMLVHVGLWRGQERMAVLSGPKDPGGRLLVATIPVNAKAAVAQVASKRYIARKAAKPIKLDGKLDEQAWKDAPTTGLFVNTMTGAAASQKTEAKILWDASNLYIAFENADTDVWGSLDKRDDKLWSQEAVEVMIDADRNGKSYVELQVSPNGTIFDTYLPEYRKYENDLDPKRKLYDWNSKAKVGVNVIGTLNKRADQDKGWVAEIAIPLADANGLATPGVTLPPKLGDTWRINLFRLDSPEGKPQQASGWSPPMVGDFHALDKFGELVFGDEKGQLPTVAAAPDRPRRQPARGRVEGPRFGPQGGSPRRGRAQEGDLGPPQEASAGQQLGAGEIPLRTAGPRMPRPCGVERLGAGAPVVVAGAWLAVCTLLAGCAGNPAQGGASAGAGTPRADPATTTPTRAPRAPRRPPVLYVPAGPGAKTYEAAPLPAAGPAGGPAGRGKRALTSGAATAGLDELELSLLKAVVALAADEGVTPPVPDARLHAVAADLARSARGMRLPPTDVLRFLGNHHGVIQPDAAINILTGPAYIPGAQEEYRRSLVEVLKKGSLGKALKKGEWNRIGVAALQRKEDVTLILTLWEQHVEMRPVPRELPSEGHAALQVRVLGPYKLPQIVVTFPGGHVRQLPTTSKDGFLRTDLRCTSGDGRYQVEILASGASGPLVLANFPVFCGVRAPVDISAYDENDDTEDIDPADAEQELLALINQARLSAGLNALAWDNRLAAIARSHSRDMVSGDFVAHVSPTTGDAAARVQRAGLAFPSIGENVGQEGGVLQAHRAIMASPGHRANVVNPKLTHVGIGVVIKSGGEAPLFVTELFAAE